MAGASIPGTRFKLPVFGANRAGAVPAASADPQSTKFLAEDGTFRTPTGGSGDVTGPSSSVDSEVAIFSGTTGKIIKRAAGSGLAWLTSGVLSSTLAPTGLTGLGLEGVASVVRLKLSANANVARILSFRTADVARWALRVDGAEPGADAGADLAFRRYDDAGNYIADALTLRRSDGRATIPNANITGGSVAGITDLAVADGGTGASTKAGARTNLGIVIAVHEYTTAGSSALTIPTDAVTVTVELCVGAGGGGGGGRRGAAGSSRLGGGGGAAGGRAVVRSYDAAVLRAIAADLTVTRGTGGPGGNGATVDSTSGSAGTAGTASTVTCGALALAYAAGGAAGAGGTGSTGNGGAATVGEYDGGDGASSTVSSTPSTPLRSLTSAGGGGAGGAISNANVMRAGGAGGTGDYGRLGSEVNPGGGSTGGGNGTSATAPSALAPGSGGGGGGSSDTGNAGNGGAGTRGGGGGGGGASVNGVGNGGNGGAGGDGCIRIVFT